MLKLLVCGAGELYSIIDFINNETLYRSTATQMILSHRANKNVTPSSQEESTLVSISTIYYIVSGFTDNKY